MGYDDLGRLLNVSCGSLWAQAFSYDQFGNISKTGSLTWACPTCYNSNNQYNSTLSASVSYDSDGNLLNDTFHKYTWDVYGHPSTIGGASGSITCGSSGTCLTYDANGRMVEKNVSGVFTEILYSPVGKTATMSGQSTTDAYFPLPAGETLYETGSTGGNRFFWHKDWLGTVRLESNIGSRVSVFDRAFAPFGEMYNNFGATTPLSFTGDTQDTIAGLFDTPNRELHPNQGRWISPDPAGMSAADPSNPQSWNRYAYVLNNPLIFTDPLGLQDCTMDGVDSTCAMNAAYMASLSGDQFNAMFRLIGYRQSNVIDPSTGQIISSSSTPEYEFVGPQDSAANNFGGYDWGVFWNGVLHGVRKPGQSFWRCVNQNANETTGGAVNAVSTQAVAATLAVGGAIGVTATIPGAGGVSTSAYQQVSGSSLPLISMAQQFGSWVALMGGSSLGVAKVAGYVTGGAASGIAASTVALAGGISGLAIGSAINCR